MQVPENIGSKYRLIVLAGKRVDQLQKGAKPRVENYENLKLTEIAIRESMNGKLTFHKFDDQQPEPEVEMEEVVEAVEPDPLAT